ncbi:DUF3558 family protein [Nocardia neocaledoniensis]|uniref:DUF3558 family protein n=1 Tax=Nocardia neocaledoniensis TaxID=236511 RepID=UPI0024567A0C|nr:DUF3558 family protein [Nocardia neocaledoniensis]
MNRIAIAAAVLIVASGCSDTHSSTIPEDADQDFSLALVDPCNLPPEAIADAGLNYDDRRNGTIGSEFAGWNGCGWNLANSEVAFHAYTSIISLQTLRTDSRYSANDTLKQGFREISATSLNGVDAAYFANASDPNQDRTCWIAASVPHGVVLFWLLRPATAQSEVSPPAGACAETARIGAKLVKYFMP